MADSKSTAYALVDKDVTQDANLLVPDMNSPSNNQRTTQDATQGADLLNPGDDSTMPPSKPDTVAKDKKQNSRLLRLPTEVKQNIWTLVVTCDDPITPYQVATKSNKFLWNAAQVADKFGDKHKISAAGPLMVASLTHTCKEMYTDISLSHLFYRNNHFDFSLYPSHFIAYLVAITDERRRAIVSMHFSWNTGRYRSKVERRQSMVLIASCKSLRSLKLSVTTAYYSTIVDPSKFFTELSEYKLTFAAMQGLKELDLVPSGTASFHDPDFVKLKAACKIFKDHMAGTMATERTGKYDLKVFRQAQETARLDIDGEGRLSIDKKPGIVSSRTRSRVAKVKTHTPDGVLPPREVPKYDLDGMLAWYVKSVLDCREGSSDDGFTGIEFQLECEVREGFYPSYPFNSRTETCWEDASAVGLMARDNIVKFYQDNPDKPGISVVYEEWLVQGGFHNEIEGITHRRAKSIRMHNLQGLEVIMKNKVKTEKAKEAEEAKEAKAKAKADKAAAAKAKKAAAAKSKSARRARGKKA